MEKITVFENELVPVYVTDKGEHIVDGRELWEALKVKSKFADRIKNRMEECDAVENEDFESFSKILENGGRSKEYIVKLDTAKEMSMLERNEVGKAVRKYFIRIEKKYIKSQKKLPTSYKEALQQLIIEIEEKEKLEAENSQQKQLIEELKPKADYTELILQNESVIAITQIAKDYGMSGIKFNALLHRLKVQYKIGEQWVLYANYQDKGYTHSATMTYNDGEGCYIITMWTQKGRLFLYNLLKKQGILPLIEQEQQQLALQC